MNSRWAITLFAIAAVSHAEEDAITLSDFLDPSGRGTEMCLLKRDQSAPNDANTEFLGPENPDCQTRKGLRVNVLDVTSGYLSDFVDAYEFTELEAFYTTVGLRTYYDQEHWWSRNDSASTPRYSPVQFSFSHTFVENQAPDNPNEEFSRRLESTTSLRGSLYGIYSSDETLDVTRREVRLRVDRYRDSDTEYEAGYVTRIIQNETSFGQLDLAYRWGDVDDVRLRYYNEWEFPIRKQTILTGGFGLGAAKREGRQWRALPFRGVVRAMYKLGRTTLMHGVVSYAYRPSGDDVRSAGNTEFQIGIYHSFSWVRPAR